MLFNGLQTFYKANVIWLLPVTFNSTNEIISAFRIVLSLRNVCKTKLSAIVSLAHQLHPVTKHFDHVSALFIIPASWYFLSLYCWCCSEGCVEYTMNSKKNYVHKFLSLIFFIYLHEFIWQLISYNFFSIFCCCMKACSFCHCS